jgi:hypothetical protein
MLVELPEEVAELYQIVIRLERKHVGRKFTLDGHLVGSLGEVIAEQAFALSLYPPSHPIHDARTTDGKEVQIKLTGGNQIGIREEPDYLVVMRIVDPTHAEVIYNGPGRDPWNTAGKMQRNGQRTIRLNKLRQLDGDVPDNKRVRPTARSFDATYSGT